MHFFSITEGTKGFDAFGAYHLTWLFFITLFALLCYKPFKEKGKLYFYLPLIPLGLKLIRLGVLVFTDQFYSWDELPFHVCNLSLMVYFVYGLTHWKGLHNYIFGVALPAATLALIFPGFGDLPNLSYYTFESFISHGVLVVYALYLLKTGELKPNYKTLPKLLAVMLLLAVPLHAINVTLGTNFCFIEHPLENSPLMLVEDLFGLPYRLCLLVVIGLVWTVVFGLYGIVKKPSALKENKKHATLS